MNTTDNIRQWFMECAPGYVSPEMSDDEVKKITYQFYLDNIKPDLEAMMERTLQSVEETFRDINPDNGEDQDGEEAEV